jgi:hypothetical protein
MTDPKAKPADPKPSEMRTEPSPEVIARAEAEEAAEIAERNMADYMWNGTIDGEAFDGDPADLDFF